MLAKTGCMALALIYTASSHSQCVNSIKPSCAVYSSCFAKVCACADSDEYLLSFGQRYCEAFLEAPGLSESGKRWRDGTLRCLQEAIVPIVPLLEEGGSCNCTKLKEQAFESHVECYTNPENSVCDLAIEDILTISRTILSDGAFTSIIKEYKVAAKQVKELVNKCSLTAKDDGSRNNWMTLNNLLDGIIN
jgi:hypothetical protein